MPDEPEREIVAAVEVEAAQAVEFVEEVVAEALSLIEVDERDDAVLVDEGDERGLDVLVSRSRFCLTCKGSGVQAIRSLC